MFNVFFTKDYYHFFNALQRFFLYVLNIELIPLSNLENIPNDSIINIFLFKVEKESHEFLLWTNMGYRYKIIFLDLGNKDKLDLLDLDNLSKNIIEILDNKIINDTAVFSKEDLKLKVSKFFKGHGEESLFEVLNWTRYFLLNGINLYKHNEITFEEFGKNFFFPGINYLSQFIERFNKYSYYLTAMSFVEETNKIKLYISELEKLLQLPLNDRMKNYNENLSEEIIIKIDLLKKIDDILTQINKKAIN